MYGIWQKKKGFTFYHTGNSLGLKRVGFLINLKFKNYIIEIKVISGRIAILKLRIYQTYLVLIQVSAPTAVSTEDEIENFYELLNKTFFIN